LLAGAKAFSGRDEDSSQDELFENMELVLESIPAGGGVVVVRLL
jgi:hypothetical protein